MAPGMPKPKLTDEPGTHLVGGTAGDDRAHAEGRRLGSGAELGSATDLAADGGIVGAEIALGLVRDLDHGVDQNTRQRDLARGQGAARDDARRPGPRPCRRCCGRPAPPHTTSRSAGLVDQADIAAGSAEAAPDDGEIDPQWEVAQQFATAHRDQLGARLLGGQRSLVAGAAAVSRVGEGAEADMGDQPRAAGADLAQQQHDRPGGQRIGLDRLRLGQRLHARRPGPVAADHALDQTLMGKAVEPAFLGVADAECMDQGQAARMSRCQEPALDRGVDRIRLDQAARPSR